MTNNYYEQPRPVRKLPTREQIAHSYTRTGNRSKQQSVPQQNASRHRVGHHAGLHPEDQPYITGDTQQGVVSGDYDLEEDDAYYNTRPPTSVRRYQQTPDVSTKQGRVNVVAHYHDQPLRAHRPPQSERYTDEIDHIQVKPYRRIHPLVWIGTRYLDLGRPGRRLPPQEQRAHRALEL